MQSQFQINHSHHIKSLLSLREQSRAINIDDVPLSFDDRMKISQTLAVLDMQIECSFKI